MSHQRIGSRPLPSCLGGGDLDGDVYNLISLKKYPEFTPSRKHDPAIYPPAERKLVDHPSTMEDVADFVMEYINSDVRDGFFFWLALPHPLVRSLALLR